MPNSDAVTALQATVQVKKFEVTGCSRNPAPSGADARLFGSFFNTGTPTPGTFLNDVTAQFRILRESNSTDPSNVLRVIADVGHCTAVDCSAGTSLGRHDLGSIRVGQTVTLRIQWDPDNDQFIFQRDDNPEVVVPYTLSDTALPGAKIKDLFVSTFPVNCTVEPRPLAYLEAFFNDVFVNESAAP